MLSRRWFAALPVSVLALAAACAEAEPRPRPTPPPTAIPTPAFEASFAYNACTVELPDGQEEGDSAVCGTLTVLENRDSLDEGTIELAIAILKATGPNPQPDPLIYLSGGPGGPALEYDMQRFSRSFARPIQRDRDIIFFDQRGVGRSDPALDCPEIEDVFFDDDAGFDAALAACSGRLRLEGVNLDAYNSIENAADIADLARALEYNSYNLFGVSYGTRLALTAMRDAPDSIRSVVLDSAFPLQANLYADGGASFEESLRAVFGACTGEAACERLGGYDALASTFFGIADRLDAEPIIVDGYGPGGDIFEAEVDGDVFVQVIFEALYDPYFIADFPAVMSAIEDGDTEPLEDLVSYSAYFNSGSSIGMHLSVQCSEEVPFNDAGGVRAVSPAYRRLDATAREEIVSVRESCSAWNVLAGSDRENEPVISDIPTLVLAGEYDPITPPSYGRETARTLSRSFVFEFPGFTHGILEEGCPMDIVADFIEQPESPPDASCIEDLPPTEFSEP